MYLIDIVDSFLSGFNPCRPLVVGRTDENAQPLREGDPNGHLRAMPFADDTHDLCRYILAVHLLHELIKPRNGVVDCFFHIFKKMFGRYL